MSYTIDWLVPDHILKIVLPVRFDNAAIRPYDHELVAYLDQATQTLHLVVDVRSVDRTLVPSLRVLTHLKHVTHPRLGWVVTIGMARTPFFGFLTSFMASLTGFHICDVASVEDALAFLKTVDKRV
jgi:hypothetical protein